MCQQRQERKRKQKVLTFNESPLAHCCKRNAQSSWQSLKLYTQKLHFNFRYQKKRENWPGVVAFIFKAQHSGSRGRGGGLVSQAIIVRPWLKIEEKGSGVVAGFVSWLLPLQSGGAFALHATSVSAPTEFIMYLLIAMSSLFRTLESSLLQDSCKHSWRSFLACSLGLFNTSVEAVYPWQSLVTTSFSPLIPSWSPTCLPLPSLWSYSVCLIFSLNAWWLKEEQDLFLKLGVVGTCFIIPALER